MVNEIYIPLPTYYSPAFYAWEGYKADAILKGDMVDIQVHSPPIENNPPPVQASGGIGRERTAISPSSTAIASV